MKNKPFSDIFTTKLPPPNADAEVFVVVCILVVILLSFFAGYRFILPAGIGVELPSSSKVQYVPTSCVITVKSESLLILNDEISSIKTLASDLGAKVIREGNGDFQVPILLRLDAAITLDNLIKICEILKQVGYANVHIALNKSF